MILHGDCMAVLPGIEKVSVNCCVTSPPYYGLRDYQVPGQIGLESTPERYVEKLVAVFREVWRVLKDDGTLWLNLGDSYASGKGICYNPGGGKDSLGKNRKDAGAHPLDRGNISTLKSQGLKPKDLIGIPWRVAFALQADGWYLRQDIIWSKTNPMPESVKDRCTKSHEYIFLLSKSKQYYFDQDAIKEPVAPATILRCSQDVENQKGSDRVPGKTNGPMKAIPPASWKGSRFDAGKTHHHQLCRSQAQGNRPGRSDGGKACNIAGQGYRNRRSVWTVSTKPFKGAHFAVFPKDLIEPCILAGCPPRGTVLDPFCGAGTTGLVCVEHGRRFTGIELSGEYVDLTRKRLTGSQLGMGI